jgi:transposase-like protein
MRKSRFSEEQIIRTLKEHTAGLSASDGCRKHGISDATFYKWRSRFGGMEVSDARKLKALEDENRKFKKLLAESMLDVSTLDTLVSGRRFRILTVVDDFTRECLGLVADSSLTAPRVVRELSHIIESRGCPRMIVSDNGTEFTSNAILAWQEERGIEWHYIARANRCRMTSARASTASFVTSASTKPCS